jgi:hypothetical protein
MKFRESLNMGVAGESVIAQWLKRRGYIITPAYEKIIDDYKGPAVYLPDGDTLVSPDMFCMKVRDRATYAMYIEAKTKTRFSWFRIKRRWETGIDQRHFEDYQRVQQETKLPVHLLFLHTCNVPSVSDLKYGCPSECPTGLFYGRLDVLTPLARHGTSKTVKNGATIEEPMVYWGLDDLRLRATLEEINLLRNQKGVV